MTPNEIYVLETLAASVRGTVTEGENPPDGYITVDRKRIAIEVSRLVEHVSSENGETQSRLSTDVPAQTMAGEIEAEIAESIPEGTHIFLIIGSPVNNIRKTRQELQRAIVKMIESDENTKDIELCRNNVSINIYRGWPANESKISSAIANRYSSSNITQNVEAILADRIATKTLRQNRQSKPDEYWLALFNDYWIADAESYRVAYDKLQIPHDFDQIVIVDGYGRTSSLC